MDINRSLNFAFQDEKWFSKLGTGVLISLVPILNLAWSGYTIEIMRRVAADHEKPLSEWDDIGAKWIDGLYLALAGLIYSLPGIIFLVIPIGIFTLPAFIQDSDAQNAVALLTTATGLLLFAGFIIYVLLLSLLFPAVQLSYSQSKTFKSCFEIAKIFRWIKAAFGEYMIAWAATIAAGIVISIPLGIVAALIGWIPCLGQILLWALSAVATLWVAAFSAHLFGQFGSQVISPSLTIAPDPEAI